MLKGNEAQSIRHVALSQSLGALFFFTFLLLAPVIVVQIIAIMLNQPLSATICSKLFRRLPIFYCIYIYRFISLTYSFCLPFVAKGNLDGTPSPLKCPNCGILCWQSHVTIYPMQIHEPKAPNYHLWFWQIYTFSKSCYVRWAMVTWYFPILMFTLYIWVFVPLMWVCFPIVRLSGSTACPSGWAGALTAPWEHVWTNTEGLGWCMLQVVTPF